MYEKNEGTAKATGTGGGITYEKLFLYLSRILSGIEEKDDKGINLEGEVRKEYDWPETLLCRGSQECGVYDLECGGYGYWKQRCNVPEWDNFSIGRFTPTNLASP